MKPDLLKQVSPPVRKAAFGSGIITLVAGFFLTLAASAQAKAQENPAYTAGFTFANRPEMHPALLPDSHGLLVIVFDSAETQKPNRWLRYAIPAAATAGWTATYFFIDHDLRHDLPYDQSNFKDFVAEWAEPLGRSATIVPGFGGLLAYGLVAKNEKARKAGAIGIATFYLNDGLSTQLKKAFGRMRPYTGAPYNQWFSGEPHRSFPSSHTSTAFAAATVLSSVYKENKLVAPISYSVAAVVGFSRLYHNQHWASDVVSGAIVGYLSAKAVVWSYSFIEKKWKGRSRLSLLPVVAPNKVAATAVLSF